MAVIFASRLKKTEPLRLNCAKNVKYHFAVIIDVVCGLIMLIIKPVGRYTKMRRSLSQCDIADLFSSCFISLPFRRIDIPPFFS